MESKKTVIPMMTRCSILVHAMRERIVTSPAFTSEHILAAILFEKTMDRTFAGQPAADYLWDTKKILPILKVDKGLPIWRTACA